jgi:PleD family two-component response regulator
MTPEFKPAQPWVLVAEDHTPSRNALQKLLEQEDFRVTTATTGGEAREILEGFEPPLLVLLDWMLPDVTGLELCRQARMRNSTRYIYLVIITARDTIKDLSEAFAAGADDFIRKPFDHLELVARLKSGQRILALEQRLAARVAEVEHALERVRKLERLMPICMYCKRVRKDPTYWQEIDEYIHLQTGADFSHGICPDCMSAVQLGARPRLRPEIP